MISSTKRLCECLAILPREPSNEIGTIDPPPRHTLPNQHRNIEKENILTYPTQTKLAHHTTSTAGNRTTVFDRRRPRVETEAIQLELRLVAHLPPGREDFGCVQRRGMRGARSRC